MSLQEIPGLARSARYDGPSIPSEQTSFVSTSPGSEGEVRTGGISNRCPTPENPIRIRIVGDRDIQTGEVRNYHKDVDGTYLYLTPLAIGQEIVIPQ